jgi:hypothetical protein
VTTQTGRNLQSVSFQIQDILASSTCVGATCTRAKIFDPVLDLVCPGDIGKTCTYDIHLEAQVQVTPRDAGLFQFLVDGVAPVPGPTDSNGFFAWIDNDPDSNVLTHLEVKSYTLVAKVTNAAANQTHFIEVRIACSDTEGSGSCRAKSGLSVLEVKIHKP